MRMVELQHNGDVHHVLATRGGRHHVLVPGKRTEVPRSELSQLTTESARILAALIEASVVVLCAP